MKRMIIILGLLILIGFIIMIYIIFPDNGERVWFINEGGNFVPVDGQKRSFNNGIEFLKPAYWAFLGIVILLYLKILWKLISLTWRSIDNKREKRQLRKYG